jgi:hypothetical protein
MGPGKHLKGLTLMGGIVKPEEFDYFHEACLSLTHFYFIDFFLQQLIINQEIARCGARGYGDGRKIYLLRSWSRS